MGKGSRNKSKKRIKMAKEDKQKLYREIRDLDEEIKRLNATLENIDEQTAELQSNNLILNKFLKMKKGDELKVPLISGVYITAELKDVKNLLVNVGSSVSVEKTPEDVQKIFDSQLVELTSYRQKIVDQMKAFIKRLEEIQDGLE